MAKIFITMFPEFSAFNATFALAYELKKRNHNIIYTGPSQGQKYIQSQGFEYISYGEQLDEDDYLSNNYYDSLRKMNEIIELFNPDLALVDPLALIPSIFYLRHQVPMLCLNTTLAYRFRMTSPPIFSHKIPENPHFIKNKIGNLITWVSLVQKNYNLWQTHPIIRLLRYFDYLNEPFKLNNKIRQLGGQLVYGEYGPRLKLPELVLSPAEIDTPWNVSIDKRTYVGACVYPKRSEPLFGGSFLLESKKPLVYCSLGTYNKILPHAKRLLNAVYDSFKNKPQYNLILHGGQILKANNIKHRTRNIYVSEVVPQLKVLEKAECFITHGGFSSIREACFYGVPMIVFPVSNDGFGNSARVVYHNIGMRGDIKTINKLEIDNMVESILKSNSIKQSIKKMGSAFKRQEGCSEGIKFIEDFIKNPNLNIGRGQ